MSDTKVVQALAALSNGTRFEIFRLLAAESPAGLSPSIIAERLEIGPSVASYHLFRLLRSGLVTRQRRGSRVIYRAQPQPAEICASLAGTLAEAVKGVCPPPAD